MFTVPGKAPSDPEEPPPEPPPPPGTGARSRWQLGATMSGSIYTISPDRFPDVHGNSASGGVSVTHFLSDVVDDGAPRSLQPFLQRTSTIFANVGGGGFVTRNPSGGQDRTDSNVSARAGFDVYVTRFLALTGSFQYGYDVLHDVMVDQTSHAFTPSGGIGVRVGDVRFDATYTFAARTTNGTFAPLRWGTAELSAYMVFDRRVSLSLFGLALQSGGMGGGTLEIFPHRDVGIYAGGFGARGQLYAGDQLVNRYGGDAGLAVWVAPRLRVEAWYDITKEDRSQQTVGTLTFNGYGEVTHTLSLAAAVRVP